MAHFPAISKISFDEKLDFKFTCHFRESHQKIIYAVEFCYDLGAGQPTIFATCGSNTVTLYACQSDGKIKLLQCYEDSDRKELYYALAWSCKLDSSEPILAVAGRNGIIRIIYPTTSTLPTHLLVRDAVNDLKFHPEKPEILLIVGNDAIIQLWNIKTNICVATFDDNSVSHSYVLLSADFDLKGDRIVTSGCDCVVRIWRLDEPLIQEAIEASYNGRQAFTRVKVPEFRIANLHGKYVDCVKWFGNWILSKSNEDSIISWKPGELQENIDTDVSAMIKFGYPGNLYYSLRFSLDFNMNYMAVGNDRGSTYVWKMNETKRERPKLLKHSACKAVVRATAFSKDSKILITVCDDGTVSKWDRTM